MLATVAAVIAAATFASTRPVIAAPAEQPAIVDPDTDAKFLARGLSISLPEARKRLAAQDEVGRVSEVRGARVRIDHKNPKGLTVEVLQAPGENRSAVAGEMAAVPGISQVSVRDVPISETGLGARAVAGKKWAERVTGETFDVRGDELTGRTVIVIDSASGFDQLQSAAGKPAFVDVERGPVARPTAAIWAGEQINGGALCTLGFGVIKAGIKYTTTAAHSPCNIADTYQYGGTLPTQFSQFGGSSDLSIRNTGANLATNKGLF